MGRLVVRERERERESEREREREREVLNKINLLSKAEKAKL